MGEAKVGEEFIKHEFDEAIAIQRAIVEAEKTLSTAHPYGAREAGRQGRTQGRPGVPREARDAWVRGTTPRVNSRTSPRA